MSKNTGNSIPRKRHMMAAVVLGTALTALGVTPASANQIGAPSARAVSDISRYCTACWRNARLPADSWEDCTQEVFNRLVQTLTPQTWERVFKAETGERQEFLRAIDAVKKRTQRQIKKTTYVNGVVADHSSGKERNRLDEREAVHMAANEILSKRLQTNLKLSLEC